jgi:N-acetyl-anhydromuramyl-L-alanine amidase AmpD
MKKRNSTAFIVVHGAWTPPDVDIGAQDIREWHLDKGWDDIGYHFVIRRDGHVERGRPWDLVGAHTRGSNEISVAICLAGGKEPRQPTGAGRWEFNYTYAQLDILKRLIDALLLQYPGAEVVGHRDLDGRRACPGFDVKAWWSQLIPFDDGG